MEGLWRMFSHWRKAGSSLFPYQALVYLYFVSYAWLPYYSVHGPRLLDEHETLHPDDQEEPCKVVGVKKGKATCAALP